MEYSDARVSIIITEEKIVFSGALEKIEYGDIRNFLEQGEQTISASIVALDFTALRFINSAGLRTLGLYIIKSAKTFEIYIDQTITWQMNTMGTLKGLKPGNVMIASENDAV